MKEAELAESIKILRKDFPQLNIKDIRIIGRGWDHTALEVNDSIIFRLPTEVSDVLDQANTVQYEINLLRLLQNKLPIDIPDPQYVASDKSYFGYPKLDGVIVSSLLSNFRKNDLISLKEDWVNLAFDLHQAVPVNVAKKLGIPIYDPQERIEIIRHFGSQYITDALVKEFAEKTIEATLRIDIAQQNLVFIHNDLQFTNILADPKTKRMTGVIDWSDCCIAPLAKEFSIWEWWHDDSIEQVAAAYEAKSNANIDVQQAKTWMHLEEIADFIEQCEEKNHKGAKASLGHINKWIKEESYTSKR